MAVSSNLRWEDLELALTILRRGSLSRAAATLGIRQSTASRRLYRLEQTLGTSLFHRLPEGMAPTPLALEMREEMEQIELCMSNLHRTAAGRNEAPAGRVRIALPDGLATVWLVPGMTEFHERYPDVSLDLVIGNDLVDLVRRQADIAVRFVRPTSADLVSVTLTHVPLAPYAHASLARRSLQSMRWVHLNDPDRQYFETRWVMEEVAPPRTMTVSQWGAMFAAVQAGIGPAILPVWVAEQAGLVRLDHPTPVEPREIFLVYHRGLRAVPRIAAVRGWLQERARLFDQEPLIDAVLNPLP